MTLSAFRLLFLGVAVAHVVNEVEEGPDLSGVAFAALVAAVEPRLRRALVAAYGPEVGRDAAADALAWAWEHFDQVETMERPAGYLWRVGQTSVRRQRRHERFEFPVSDQGRTVAVLPADMASDGEAGPWDEVLIEVLRTLSVHQRVAVVLVHAYGYPLGEAADVLGCRVSTLRNHLARGVRRIRTQMERGAS